MFFHWNKFFSFCLSNSFILLMGLCSSIFNFCFFFVLPQLSLFLCHIKKCHHLFKYVVLLSFINLLSIEACQSINQLKPKLFLKSNYSLRKRHNRKICNVGAPIKRIQKWKVQKTNDNINEIYANKLGEENVEDILLLLKDKCEKEKKKNIIFIEKGEKDKNKITYINDTLNNEVKKIIYLTDFQKNFIYLIERKSNLLLHAKTSSGKTTICLFYFILKFFHKCEFIFQEDIERRNNFVDQNYFERWKKQTSDKNKKYVGINKCFGNPFSVQYTEFLDLSENRNILLEEKTKLKLKKDEHILILCPSKELCVQICYIIFSLGGTNSEHIVRLFIDKENEINLEKGMKTKTNKSTIKENCFTNLKNTMFLVGTPLCFKNAILKMKQEKIQKFLKSIKYIFLDELDKLLPIIKKYSSLKKKKNAKIKSAHLIFESIMYVNTKDIIFVGASSTLNRPLHRSVFHLLCLNKHNRKKKMFLLREKREIQKLAEKGKEEEEIKEYSDTIIKNNIYNQIDDETVLVPKHVIKVKIPNTVEHFYYVVKNESVNDKLKDLYNIIKTSVNKKILILIKNGCSLMKVKNFLQAKNVYCILLHEELKISLFENNENKKKLSENYKKIKDVKPIDIDIKRKENINKYPVIISSFDSIRGFHINNLNVVILFNKAKNVNEYIHLSGRVGRNNITGQSILLENEKHINVIKSWLNNLGVGLKEYVLKKEFVEKLVKEGMDLKDKKEMDRIKEENKKSEKHQKKQLGEINETNDFDYVKWNLLNELTESEI